MIIKITAVPIKVRVKVTITETVTGTVKFAAEGTPVMGLCLNSVCIVLYTYLSLNCFYLNYSG